MGADELTREPEMVKAFTDAWRDGIHSYMSYLRDRMLMGRDLLAKSGSMFVQISDTNQHRVRALMDEVFGANNFVRLISFRKTPGGTSNLLSQDSDYLVWYAKSKDDMKYRELAQLKNLRDDPMYRYMISDDLASTEPLTEEHISDPAKIPNGWRAFRLTALGRPRESTLVNYEFQGVSYNQGASRGWRTNKRGMDILAMAGRLAPQGTTLNFRHYFDDYGAYRLTNTWTDLGGARGKRYVVETNPKVIRRCILMTTDPGDLVLDPTCGGGTTAFVAEQWGRRWITIDTSRIAITLTRSRIMGGRFDFYRLNNPSNIRGGFANRSVAHVTLKSIVNNAKIAEIYEKHQPEIDNLRRRLNGMCETDFEEWEIGPQPDDDWPPKAKKVHEEWWIRRTKRQVEIDKEIANSAGEEPVYEAPFVDREKVRVSGPFTVESVLPHRVLPSTTQTGNQTASLGREDASYVSAVLANLKASGASQTSKADHINFTRIVPFADDGPITAEGEFTIGAVTKNSKRRKAAILIAGQFDTLGEADIAGAAREAAKFNFDALICCAFRFDAQAVGLTSYGKIDIHQAVMNAELHMADKTKLGARPDLFFVIGEPDIALVPLDGDQFLVRVNGMDVYDSKTREAKASERGDIAMWFMDTNYNNDCFIVRHAYFLDASDPFDNLKKTLKSDINAEAWATLNSDVSRPFPKPTTGYIAVKVINRFGDEVMKVVEIK